MSQLKSDKTSRRIQNIIDEGAKIADLILAGTATLKDWAGLIDHTILRPDTKEEDIARLCEEAIQYGFASVCVNPIWVRKAASYLKDTNIPVGAAIGFPLGSTLPDVKTYETRRAIFDGAREVDMVINIGALKAGDIYTFERDIELVVEAAHEFNVVCKVIIETCLLTDEEKLKACGMVKRAGADYVKTSTGFSKSGATVEDVSLMRNAVGKELGVKASGGIRNLEDARKLIEAGATRIGTSAGLIIMQEMAASH
jgi:deoxyribose-phosphate aldolase